MIAWRTGWWHEGTALETSIHVSLLAFRRPNTLSWYQPGDPMAEILREGVTHVELRAPV
ncbi:MAG TPA: hypothetical protein VM694_15820 [Polyangium sp.]|nr:hypothetical protein [Polyangium sp.]